jgi:hypothetical protein
MVLARMGRVEDAKRKLALFRRVANQEPHLGSPMMGRYLALAEAEVLWEEASRREAEEVHREAAETFAGTVTPTDVWVLLEERLTEVGEMDRAEQVWQRAHESNPETGHWHNYDLATRRWAELLKRESAPKRPLSCWRKWPTRWSRWNRAVRSPPTGRCLPWSNDRLTQCVQPASSSLPRWFCVLRGKITYGIRVADQKAAGSTPAEGTRDPPQGGCCHSGGSSCCGCWSLRCAGFHRCAGRQMVRQAVAVFGGLHSLSPVLFLGRPRQLIPANPGDRIAT